MTRLSVVIPAYNEERVIGDSLARVGAYLEQTPDPELIVVDDGSQDRTCEIVRETALRYPFTRLIQNDRNRGKGYSIKHGIAESRGEYVLFTDADLVYPIEGVEPFIRALDAGADVAISSRSHPGTLFALHPRHFSYIYQRYLVGQTYINIVNRILGLDVTDTQAGFKCLRGDAARTIFARTTLYDFAFDVEALFIARQLGYRIVELPVYFLYLGEQSSVQLVKDSVRMLFDLWTIRQNGKKGVYLRGMSDLTRSFPVAPRPRTTAPAGREHRLRRRPLRCAGSPCRRGEGETSGCSPPLHAGEGAGG
jgi:dolichyl-phosphate beta-glucosyltransferase